MRFWVAVSLLLCGVVLGLACDSDGNPETALCTNEETVEALRSDDRTSYADGKRPIYPGLPDDEIQCHLRRAILTLDDLGGGWEPALSSSGSGRATAPCFLPIPGVVADVGVGYEAANEDEIGFISHSIVLMEDGHAPKLMEALRRTCRLLGARPEEDSSFGSGFSVDESVDFGDDSLTLEESSGGSVVQYVVERRGSTVSILTLSKAETGEDIHKLAQATTERLARLGPMPEPTPFAGSGCEVDEGPYAEQDQELARALITIEDLDEGWVEDPPSDCPFVRGDEFYCTNAIDEPTPVRAAEITIIRGRIARIGGFSHAVELYEGDDAESLFDALDERNVESSCEATTGDTDFTWSFQPIEETAFGDESEAWFASTSGLPAGRELNWYIVWIRRGDHVAWVGYSSELPPFSSAEPSEFFIDEFFEIVAIADRKLSELTD
jgi:hypothetical protein